MIKIGNISFGNVPRIALTVSDQESSNSIKKARVKGADILEVRVDKFKSIKKDYVVKIIKSLKNIGLPVIATIRSKKEGGEKHIPDDVRMELFNVIIPLVDAVDVEFGSKSILDKVISKSKSLKKVVIVSYHNFKETPQTNKIINIIKKSKNKGSNIVKIAAFAKNIEDVIRLMEITMQYKDKNLIAVSLGANGTISRVFFPFIGSLITYTFVNASFAPGQISIDDISDEFLKFYPDFNKRYINP